MDTQTPNLEQSNDENQSIIPRQIRGFQAALQTPFANFFNAAFQPALEASYYTNGGWYPLDLTFTYASASTFTTTGDVTTLFQKGDFFGITQTTAKYFYLKINPTFGGGVTTFTVNPNTAYTVANAAITSPKFARGARPLSFPKSFTFDPTPTGFSSITLENFEYTLHGGVCTASFIIFGASNLTTFTTDLPIAAGALGFTQHNPIYVTDNSTDQAGPGYCTIASGGSTLTFFRLYTLAASGWTNSNNKGAISTISWII